MRRKTWAVKGFSLVSAWKYDTYVTLLESEGHIFHFVNPCPAELLQLYFSAFFRIQMTKNMTIYEK